MSRIRSETSTNYKRKYVLLKKYLLQSSEESKYRKLHIFVFSRTKKRNVHNYYTNTSQKNLLAYMLIYRYVMVLTYSTSSSDGQITLMYPLMSSAVSCRMATVAELSKAPLDTKRTVVVSHAMTSTCFPRNCALIYYGLACYLQVCN